MRVAIIILNYNGKHFLEKYIPILSKSISKETAKIIVADNASTDDSLEYLRSHHSDVEIFEFDRNYGFAEGYNIAIKRTNTEYVLLLNSDVEVTPGFLEPLVDYMDANPKVAACQPKILQMDNREYFEKAGAAGGMIDVLGYPFCRGRIMDHTEKDNGQYDNNAIVFWASGACMFVRRDDFIDYGGFDADFFAHQEEIDLCFRFNARDRQVAAVPKSVVYHLGGGTLNYNDPKKTYLNFRNNLFLLYKNLHTRHLIPVLIARFFLDYLAALVFLLKGDFRCAGMVIKARFDYLRMKSKFKEKRRQNLEVSIANGIPCVHKGSIVFEFYLFRRHSL
ncbi:MAG: glycosyltransferase family 2 protein [Paludibacteraceae bacterium]|nr:glycosyltransferase family 2 protein [Paludibacteraceae bacterium]